MGCSSSLPSGRSSSNILNGKDIKDSNCPRVKLVLLGDSGVGKSCIAMQFVKGEFDPASKVTVGASFLSKIIMLQNRKCIKFEIWDTAGQERYAALAPLYYRGAKIALIVFDITVPETFEKAKFWVKELKKHGSSSAIIALVGNKIDLSHMRRVSFQDAKEYADDNKMIYLETSAKTSQNIIELFQAVGERVPSDPES